MRHWLDDIEAVHRAGERAVSVIVVSTKGSVPREAGTRMLVTSTRVLGTIGGGNLELQAIDIARKSLANSDVIGVRRFPLGASLGQCCGGLVNLLFEPIPVGAAWVGHVREYRRVGTACVVATLAKGSHPRGKMIVTADRIEGSLGSDAVDNTAVEIARRRLAQNSPTSLVTLEGENCLFETIAMENFCIVLFGAGHVARALVSILSGLSCMVIWIDSREVEFPSELPANVEKVISDTPESEVGNMPAASYFLVMTHSHQLDQFLCEHILRRNDFAYFGLIGSISKRRQFEQRLIARGVPHDRLTKLTCPIGSAGIASKEPMAIAVCVAAELLQRREALEAAKANSPIADEPSRSAHVAQGQ